MNRERLIELFITLRNSIIYKGKFRELSDLVVKQIENSYFFNRSKVICLYNHNNSVILNNVLLNESNYFNNSFVFPRLENGQVFLYHVSSPNDLIIDNFGAIDVVSESFKIDIADIDVILVSGMSFDNGLRVLNIGENDELYKSLLNSSDASKLGVCLDCQVYRQSLPESDYKVDGLITEEGCYFPVNI